MSHDPVRYESSERIAYITIDRADKLNAISPDVEDALADAWVRFNASDDRVAILSGAGEKAFSVGKDMNYSERPDYRRFTPNVSIEVDKPIIAAVNGWCIGGAIVLVQMCDLCVVSEDAKFRYPEAQMGFAGGLIASMASRIPHKVAMELMLTGDVISGQRMYDVGFANRVAPAGKVMDQANEMAQRLARNAPLVMAMLKRFAEDTVPKSPLEQSGAMQRELNRVFESDDYQEGFRSFREKREPEFKGR